MKHESKDRFFYCLAADGQLWVLGDHGDIDAAEDTAASMGLEAVWIFDNEAAQQWRNTLSEA